jgi:hypothetical protein
VWFHPPPDYQASDQNEGALISPAGSDRCARIKLKKMGGNLIINFRCFSERRERDKRAVRFGGGAVRPRLGIDRPTEPGMPRIKHL